MLQVRTIFSDPSVFELDSTILIRLGDGVIEGKRARQYMRAVLPARLSTHEWDRDQVVMTSMPQRFNNEREHTFVSFARTLANDLGIVFVNDQFIETADRLDVSDVGVAQRFQVLQNLWEFHGRLDGKVVILLDDVVASGTSIRTAASILTGAGATVVPYALVSCSDEAATTKEVLQKHFTGRWASLLNLAEVQGSLRRSIEQWSRQPSPAVIEGDA